MLVAHPIAVTVPLNFKELDAHRPGLGTGGFGPGTGERVCTAGRKAAFGVDFIFM